MRQFIVLLLVATFVLPVSGCLGGRLDIQDVHATFLRLDGIASSDIYPEQQWNQLVGSVVTQDFAVYSDGVEITFSETEKIYEIPSKIAGLVALKHMYDDFSIQRSIDGNTLVLSSDTADGDMRLDFVRSGDKYLIKQVSTSRR